MIKCPFCKTPCGNDHCIYTEETLKHEDCRNSNKEIDKECENIKKILIELLDYISNKK